MTILKIALRLAWLAAAAVLFLAVVTACHVNPPSCAYNPEQPQCGSGNPPGPPQQPQPAPPGQPQYGTFCDNPGQRIGNAVCDPANEQGYPANTWHPA
jgi:hypothetical protein